MELVYSHITLGFSVFFAQCQPPIVFKRNNKVLAPVGDEFKILLYTKPAVHRHKAKIQLVLYTHTHHLAHQLILGGPAHALDLTGLDITVLNGLSHPLKS